MYRISRSCIICSDEHEFGSRLTTKQPGVGMCFIFHTEYLCTILTYIQYNHYSRRRGSRGTNRAANRAPKGEQKGNQRGRKGAKGVKGTRWGLGEDEGAEPKQGLLMHRIPSANIYARADPGRILRPVTPWAQFKSITEPLGRTETTKEKGNRRPAQRQEAKAKRRTLFVPCVVHCMVEHDHG